MDSVQASGDDVSGEHCACENQAWNWGIGDSAFRSVLCSLPLVNWAAWPCSSDPAGATLVFAVISWEIIYVFLIRKCLEGSWGYLQMSFVFSGAW